MTTIVACRTLGKGESSDVVMACDSSIHDSNLAGPSIVRKIFFSDSYLIGVSGYYRTLQLIEHCELPIYSPDKGLTVEFAIKWLIPVIVKHLAGQGDIEGAKSEGEGIEFSRRPHLPGTEILIAWQHKNAYRKVLSSHLVNIGVGLSALLPDERYFAIGSGAEFALGSLYTSSKFEAQATLRVLKALNAAARFDSFTSRPFFMASLSGGQVVRCSA